MIYKSFNIYSFIPELCVKEFSIISNKIAGNPRPGILLRILSLFKQLFLSFELSLKKKNCYSIPVNSILFFGQTKNEYFPYMNLISNLKPEKSNNFFVIGINKYKNDFPYLKIYTNALLFIPLVFFYYYKENDKFKSLSYKYSFDKICIVLSSIKVISNYLNKVKPNKIVVSNHNSPFHLLLLSLCQKNNIKTAYIQHALFPVVKFNFPKHINQIILDGLDSLEKLPYHNLNTSNIYVIGSSSQIHFPNNYINKNCTKSLGIAINQADEITSLIKLLEDIKLQMPEYTIILRPHPADKRIGIWKKLSFDYHLKISTPDISIYEFLSNIAFLISGESNVHLQAINLNINSYYYNFNTATFEDWYGFVKNNFILDITNTKEFTNILRLNKNYISIPEIQFYNNSFCKFEYSFICEIIRNLLLETDFDLKDQLVSYKYNNKISILKI